VEEIVRELAEIRIGTVHRFGGVILARSASIAKRKEAGGNSE
jgi:hypothetical protein